MNDQLRFKGYSASYDLWHPEHELTNCKELIAEFLKENKDPEVALKKVARKAWQAKAEKTTSTKKVPPKRVVKKKK